MQLPVFGVIMAGGSGERFWPVSRADHPKQLLYLTDDSRALIEEAVDRVRPLIEADRILIATNQRLRGAIERFLPQHPAGNILGEPCKRNTTGCLVYAAANIRARLGDDEADALIAVTTADHLIRDENHFRETARAALHFAEREDALVTIGVHPTRPETGFGYIEITALNRIVAEYEGIPVYKVARFLEKPNREDAEAYHASRFYYWNSGMFFWRLSVFEASLRQALPEAAQLIDPLAKALRAGDEAQVEALFAQLPDISIDYALMEKAGNVYVTLGDFRWDDVGAWDALERVRPKDAAGNTAFGDPLLIDCQGSIVYNQPGSHAMSVCVKGLADFIVVTTPDAVLICPKDDAQSVKQMVAALRPRSQGAETGKKTIEGQG